MEKLAEKVTKLLQKDKVEQAIDLISKKLASLEGEIEPHDIIKAYHLFYECYSLQNFEEAHKSLNMAAKYLAEEANKKIQHDQDGAIEGLAGAVIRYSFGGELDNAKKILDQMKSLPKIDKYENYHLAKSMYESLSTKNIDNLFKIQKKYKKFFNDKENSWVFKEIDYYSTPIIKVEFVIPDKIIAGSLFRLDIIIANHSPNMANKIETKIIPPRGFRIRNPERRNIRIKRLEPNEHFRYYVEFFVDEKEDGKKTIECQTVTYEDARGKKYETEFPHLKIDVGTQTGVFAGTITKKEPKPIKTAGVALGVLEIKEEDKKSVEKLKKKKELFKDVLRKNEENLNKKIITNDEYMTKYVLYREKMDEIDKYLKELGYEEKEGYTEVTCLYDGTKFYVEDGSCPRCGDLYTVFFDEMISILFFMIIHASGICVFNVDFGKKLDADLTSGLITAVQSFMGELTGQEENRFTEFSQSGFYILTCNGKHSTSAIVMSMRASDRIKDRLIQFMELFENQFENQLANFLGNLEVFKGSLGILRQFIPIELLQPYKINYNSLSAVDISPISQKIMKNVPEFKERRLEKIHMDKLVEIARKTLRRMGYGNLVAAILELQEKGILAVEMPTIVEASVEQPPTEEAPTIPTEEIQETPVEEIQVKGAPIENTTKEEPVGFCVECGAKLPQKTGGIQFCINCGSRQPD